MIGKTISHYKIIEKLGEGGMGMVYLAEDTKLKRQVALKFLSSKSVSGKEEKSRFNREAQAAAALNHPNIATIFEIDEHEGDMFIAMEYVEGQNLKQLVESGPLKLREVIRIASQIADGLYAAHARNIVHRDISPQNLLISYQGEVKISDFGISKASSEPSFTQVGVIKGKLAYMSTEQALGEPVDRRADIFALGLVFYETLTGKRVYQFDSDIEAIRAIPKMEIEPVINARPEVPEGLNSIVMKCLEKNKEARYQSASELHADLVALRKELRITFDASDLTGFMKQHFGEDAKFPNTQRAENGKA